MRAVLQGGGFPVTPAARIGAAIGILDRILDGAPAEQALTGWARASRFAGSGDRAAVRDLVFDALRHLRSFTARAGAEAPSGRALMIGRLVALGDAPERMFTAEGHAPAPLDADEVARLAAAPADPGGNVALDCPDWIAPRLAAALGPETAPVLRLMQERAPVFLRVNLRKADRAGAARALAVEGIGTAPHGLAESALLVTENSSRIKMSQPYLQGLIELQDASPQAAVAMLPLAPGATALDYCAGGGGKALALAARGVSQITAHDAAPERMKDLPARASRAGATIRLAAPRDLAGRTYDLVLADVPCSGTGTWRRTPDAKWRLTEARLAELARLQAEILDRASLHVRPGGALAYMTCSLLAEENRAQVDAFLTRRPGWSLAAERVFTPLTGGDGFYCAILTAR